MSNLSWNTRQDFLKIPSLWVAYLETERICFSKVNLESNVTPNISRSSDSFSTVPSMVNGIDWECIVRDLETITGDFTNAPAPCHPPVPKVNYWRFYQCSCTQSITGNFTNAPAPSQLLATLPMLLHPVTHRCPRSITGDFTNATAPSHPPLPPVNYLFIKVQLTPLTVCHEYEQSSEIM